MLPLLLVFFRLVFSLLSLRPPSPFQSSHPYQPSITSTAGQVGIDLGSQAEQPRTQRRLPPSDRPITTLSIRLALGLLFTTTTFVHFCIDQGSFRHATACTSGLLEQGSLSPQLLPSTTNTHRPSFLGIVQHAIFFETVRCQPAAESKDAHMAIRSFNTASAIDYLAVRLPATGSCKGGIGGTQMLYTSSAAYCSPPEAILISALDLRFYRGNRTLEFDISAASVQDDLRASVNIDVNAYGLGLFSLAIDLCDTIKVLCHYRTINSKAQVSFLYPTDSSKRFPALLSPFPTCKPWLL